MGQDYLARKASKKRAKKEARASSVHEGATKRERQQRTTPKKRLGVCFGQPVLTPADRFASDDEGPVDVSSFDVLAGASIRESENGPLESMRNKRLKATVPFEKTGSFTKPVGMAPTDGDGRSKAKEARKLKAAAVAAGQVALQPTVRGGAAKPGSSTEPVAAPALAGQHAVVRQYMARHGHVEPTPVQRQVWAAAGAGRDVVAQAPTGSGKTLAFLLPAAARLVDTGHGHHSRPEAPLALFLAPTRELAVQTHRAAKPLQALCGLRACCVYGGAERAAQQALLARSPHMVVATPGRLLDLWDAGSVRLSAVVVVALDECDKMLSAGFAPQLRRLSDVLLSGTASAAAAAVERTSAIPSEAELSGKGSRKRRRRGAEAPLVPAGGTEAHASAGPAARPQVLLTSATLPESWSEDAGQWAAADAARVCVDAEAATSISSTITQVVQVCAEHKKVAKLLKHLKSVSAAAAGARSLPRVLIFCNTIKAVTFLTEELRKVPYKVACLHGDCTQPQRDAAVHDFKAGKAQVLVATDVAARGLHIRNLPYIVNYHFPTNVDTYVHRAGRTGRVQAHGHVFSFFTRNLARLAPHVVAVLEATGQVVDPNLRRLADAFETVAAKLGPDGVGAALRAESPREEDGAEEGAGGAEALPEDLEEGLAALRHEMLLTPGGGKRKRAREGAGSATPVPTASLLPAVGAIEPESFRPCKHFKGAQRGYVFTKGSRGLGYYLDSHAPRGAGTLAAQSKRARRTDHDARAHPETASKAKAKGCAGLLGPSRAQLDAAKLAAATSSGSDDENAVSGAAANGRVPAESGAARGKARHKKALPGRLRKKLARERGAL